MDNFTNRMDAQRVILKHINSHINLNEDLNGLSFHSITRWASSNSIPANSELYLSLMAISEKLNLIANKSQEQMLDDDQIHIIELFQLYDKTKEVIRNHK